MPSHLHPRSRLTTSLFGTALLISFLVVGMPHIVPCPAPRVAFADTEISNDGQRRRIRRADGGLDVEEEDYMQEMIEERKLLVKKAHECPVPKPSGVVGEVLGFQRSQKGRREAGSPPQMETDGSER